jgi:hypothetical protein
VTPLQRLRQLCLLTAPAFFALVACSAPANINLVVTNDTGEDMVAEMAWSGARSRPTKPDALGRVRAHSTETFKDANAFVGRKLVLRLAKGKAIEGSFRNPGPKCGCGNQPDLEIPVQVGANRSVTIGKLREVG